MNVKKRLEQEAKATHQKILEESDKSFLASLQEQVSEPKCRPVFSHTKAWLTGAACTLAAALVIICTVLFLPSNKRVVYLEKDFHTSSSNIVSLNSDLTDFEFSIENNLIVKDIKRTIDAPSRDLLFYEATFRTSDSLIQIRLTIVCNKNYIYDDQYALSYQQAQLPNYNINYCIKTSVNSTFQCYDIKSYAKIEGRNNVIYVTDYQEVSLDENGSFLDFIQDLIQVKK